MECGPWRILCIINSLGAGGAERMTVTLANELSRRGHQLTVLTAYGPGELVDQLEPAVGLRSLDRPAGRIGLPGGRAMLAAIRDLQPDACLGFLHTGNRYGLVLSRRAGVKCVISSLQNAYPTIPRQAVWIDRWCFRYADAGTAVSEAVERFYRDVWRFPPDKLQVIYNAVPVRRFACRDEALRREVRAELGLTDETIACVTVANLNDQKGHLDLIAAAAAAAPEHPRVRWFCVGQGHLRDRLEQEVATRGLSDRVVFLGRRTDIPRLLQGMDLFTLPSLWEGFGIATAEAMATGLPVVATDVDGTRELVVEGETGWLVPPGDSAAMVAAWCEIWADPDEARRRGLAGRARIEARFDIGPIAGQFEALIGEILERRKRS